MHRSTSAAAKKNGSSHRRMKLDTGVSDPTYISPMNRFLLAWKHRNRRPSAAAAIDSSSSAPPSNKPSSKSPSAWSTFRRYYFDEKDAKFWNVSPDDNHALQTWITESPDSKALLPDRTALSPSLVLSTWSWVHCSWHRYLALDAASAYASASDVDFCATLPKTMAGDVDGQERATRAVLRNTYAYRLAKADINTWIRNVDPIEKVDPTYPGDDNAVDAAARKHEYYQRLMSWAMLCDDAEDREWIFYFCGQVAYELKLANDPAHGIQVCKQNAGLERWNQWVLLQPFRDWMDIHKTLNSSAVATSSSSTLSTIIRS